LFIGPFGRLIRSIGAVPIDRERGGVAGFKATLATLRDGRVLLVFPEGTRTHDGRLRPFHPGFCALARRSEATIVPIAIDGAFAAFPRGALFPRPKPISLAISQPIDSRQYGQLSDEQLCELVVKTIQAGLANQLAS
jgi:1-acyl-sn-glycerol-3-phosphate acyltransferase